jgi:hypothetical protein
MRRNPEKLDRIEVTPDPNEANVIAMGYGSADAANIEPRGLTLLCSAI